MTEPAEPTEPRRTGWDWKGRAVVPGDLAARVRAEVQHCEIPQRGPLLDALQAKRRGEVASLLRIELADWLKAPPTAWRDERIAALRGLVAECQERAGLDRVRNTA